jgi:hypothetical protein
LNGYFFSRQWRIHCENKEMKREKRNLPKAKRKEKFWVVEKVTF